MPGKWLRTLDYDGAAVAVGRNTYQLPRSNFINYIDVAFHRCGCATQTLLTAACNFTSLQVVGNGASVLKDYTMRDARAINIFDYGSSHLYCSAIVEGVESCIGVRIDFGRFVHDTTCILPAKAFKQLDLIVVATAITGANLWDLDVLVSIEVEQYISADDPSKKNILKDTIVRTDAAGTTQVDVSCPLGLWVRGFVVIVDEMTGNWYNDVTLRVNNGAEIPWTGEMYMQCAKNNLEKNVGRATYTAASFVPSTSELMELTNELEDSAYFEIDLDPKRTLEDCLHTETMNDLTLRIPRAASTAEKVLMREVIVLSGG